MDEAINTNTKYTDTQTWQNQCGDRDKKQSSQSYCLMGYWETTSATFIDINLCLATKIVNQGDLVWKGTGIHETLQTWRECAKGRWKMEEGGTGRE